MASWKKVIVSGSQAHLQGITASNLTNNTSTPTAQIVGYNPTTGIFSYFNTSSVANPNTFVQNGNSFGATAVLGTNDNHDLQFETNNSVRMTIDSSGDVGIGTASPGAQLETTEDIIVNGVNIGNGGGDQSTNTSVGAGALANNITGVVAQRNTAVGNQALNGNADGADNTALGYIALQANVNGNLNTAIGANALKLATTNENTAVGANSLFSNTGGTSNTAVGAGALYNNNGDNNTAVGVVAGKYLSDGSTANASSNQSIFIGNATRASGSNGTNEIVIGYDAIGAGDNSVVLGNTSTTKTILREGVGIGLSNTQTPSNTLQVSGSLWATTITASNIPSASNANVLLYNSASGQFSYLSTSSIGNISGTGTADRVVLWNTSTSINDDAELTFNRTSNALTIGNSTFGNNITASGNISASGNLSVTGNSTITGTETITGRLTANGAITTTNITASGNISSSGNLSVTGNSTITGTETITGRLTANGAITTTNITASGNISSSGDLFVTGNSTIGGTLGVTGVTTLSNTLNVNSSNGIATNQSTFSLLSQNVQTISFAGAATAVNIGNTTGTTTVRNNLTVDGNATITGDLTVNGTTTTIDTTNLTVEDKFIILAHGSGSISPIAEGGIIVEGSTADKGQAFLFNSGSDVNVTGRWGLAADVHATSSNVTPTDFMVSAIQALGAPSSAPTYGGSAGGYGNIYVNSTDESIWIYS